MFVATDNKNNNVILFLFDLRKPPPLAVVMY